MLKKIRQNSDLVEVNYSKKTDPKKQDVTYLRREDPFIYVVSAFSGMTQ